MKNTQKGFTLIELLIVVVIIGILAAIGFPAYSEYVLKGKLSEAYSQLTGLQVRMEQYYQDNRNYGTGTCGIPAPTAPAVQFFTYGCVLTNGGQGYKYTATGAIAATNNFIFTIDDASNKATTSVGASWSGAPASCWIRNKGGTC